MIEGDDFNNRFLDLFDQANQGIAGDDRLARQDSRKILARKDDQIAQANQFYRLDLPAIIAQRGNQGLVVNRLRRLVKLDFQEIVFIFELGVFAGYGWQKGDKMKEPGFHTAGSG